MEFSIWHWVIVLVLLGTVVIPIVAIARTPRDDLRGRAKVWQVVGAIALLVVVQEILSQTLGPSQAQAAAGLAFLLSLVISYWAARTAAARCQDLNWNRWVALLQAVPLVNLVFLLAIGILPSRRQGGGDAAMGEA
jgi:hypothetical protein